MVCRCLPCYCSQQTWQKSVGWWQFGQPLFPKGDAARQRTCHLFYCSATKHNSCSSTFGRHSLSPNEVGVERNLGQFSKGIEKQGIIPKGTFSHHAVRIMVQDEAKKCCLMQLDLRFPLHVPPSFECGRAIEASSRRSRFDKRWNWEEIGQCSCRFAKEKQRSRRQPRKEEKRTEDSPWPRFGHWDRSCWTFRKVRIWWTIPIYWQSWKIPSCSRFIEWGRWIRQGQRRRKFLLLLPVWLWDLYRAWLAAVYSVPSLDMWQV